MSLDRIGFYAYLVFAEIDVNSVAHCVCDASMDFHGLRVML